MIPRSSEAAEQGSRWLGEEILREATALFGKNVLLDEPLAKHCSFRIGGPADVFIRARNVGTLKKALRFCEINVLPAELLGRGTNVLVPDSGLRGIVISVETKGMFFDENMAVVEAGEHLQRVVKEAATRGLSGLEFAVGIPGSAGGAVFMNAGAHGAWTGGLVHRVVGIDFLGRERLFRRKDLRFGYRKSTFHNFAGVVAEFTLALREDDPRSIREKMEEFSQARRATQPVGARCAGSVFRNPKGHSAGKLIELAGCKGMRRGGAVVSRKHANFIVNRGGASYADVKGLIEDVREKVWKAHRITLKREIVDLGETAWKPGTH